MIVKRHFSLNTADSPPVIAAPSMWTRPQIKDFKEKIRQDADSVITVGRGEVVTVRVPTHEEGSYLFWEFATDYYDIGFGVFFEWTDAASASVSVHVSESSDEDEDDEGEEWTLGKICLWNINLLLVMDAVFSSVYFCNENLPALG